MSSFLFMWFVCGKKIRVCSDIKVYKGKDGRLVMFIVIDKANSNCTTGSLQILPLGTIAVMDKRLWPIPKLART